jgi:hypothetical protein
MAFQKAAEQDQKQDFDFWASAGNVKDLPYGAGVKGTLFDEDKMVFNHLDPMLEKTCGKMDGITTPYLYFGRQGTSFGFHKEDVDLHSINYLHHGANKIWIVISPKYGPMLDALALKMLAGRCNDCLAKSSPIDYGQCDQPLRHKSLLFSPDLLKEAGIPFTTIVQKPGDFVVVFAGAYHGGYNEGFNVAEAVNFATLPWISIGRSSLPCRCKLDSDSWMDFAEMEFPAVVTVKVNEYNGLQKKVQQLEEQQQQKSSSDEEVAAAINLAWQRLETTTNSLQYQEKQLREVEDALQQRKMELQDISTAVVNKIDEAKAMDVQLKTTQELLTKKQAEYNMAAAHGEAPQGENRGNAQVQKPSISDLLKQVPANPLPLHLFSSDAMVTPDQIVKKIMDTADHLIHKTLIQEQFQNVGYALSKQDRRLSDPGFARISQTINTSYFYKESSEATTWKSKTKCGPTEETKTGKNALLLANTKEKGGVVVEANIRVCNKKIEVEDGRKVSCVRHIIEIREAPEGYEKLKRCRLVVYFNKEL